MAALGALIRGDLPPAGNPIDLPAPARAADAAALAVDGYEAVLVDSGTSALALAMQLARQCKPHIHAPEVILPGYACPDLVAAAEYAGVQPVLVDIDAQDPAYRLSRLREAINANTLLIVAVNFLGIRERMAELRELATAQDIVLVEDSAQWFPEPFPGVGLDADFVLTSFGRGKPVSLLGGGVLWVKRSLGLTAAIQPLLSPAEAFRWLPLKVRAFNILLKPRLYCWLNRNPLLSLGETAFHPLSQINALDAVRRNWLSHCVAHYQRQQRRVEAFYDRELPACFPAAHLPASYGAPRRGRLLRYPLVCEHRVQRDRLLQALQDAGLGASAMYVNVLPAVTGVAGKVTVNDALDGAEAFAGRLLTLPTHAGVSERHLDSMMAVIAAAV
ncbi:hypothetical protein FKG94_19030 [Exilibacterium tricleocarpae]|uniref:DegT/DnrJ/EryC1/StrS aminotransferase family protein n=1 Tax=Exilibacterium tricleocarpae TaxID=2591008 RepID=A0A545T3F1_9GAMM|nr:DegT/DnrJ/EryC1/StrS family aminotransferase [Exilibacterium tricleocarpae]TQV71744.1 hypothetical protein FKG94_19030 [Exilibacterium tricleocarpae]